MAAKAEGADTRPLPLLLVIVKAGVRTAENVCVNDEATPSENSSIMTHVAWAPAEPLHTSCTPADAVFCATVTTVACDALKREAFSANVSTESKISMLSFT